MKRGRSSDTGKFLLDGAAMIVAVPSMHKTRAKMVHGSIAGDWRAVGNDMRRAMTAAERKLERA